MRIVALADSLALPRIEDEDVVLWEETWPFILQVKLQEHFEKVEVINCGQRRRMITSLLSSDFREHIILKRPDYLILQIGVVDAAPRIISQKERRILNSHFFPNLLKKSLINRRSEKREQILKNNPLKRVYVKPFEFSKSLGEFQERIQKLNSKSPKLVIVPILANHRIMETKSPGFVKNIGLYNQLLKEFCCTHQHQYAAISPAISAQKDFFCQDGYHLSSEGHEFLAANLTTYFL